MTTPGIPPIIRSVSVSWGPNAAFRRFTADFGTWWPWRTFSIGGTHIERIVFEPRVGGRIYEQHVDGRRFQWGRVLEWDPPRRVKFSWHPSRGESTAQDVELRFEPEGPGTRLTLTATKWENLGPKAGRSRKGYDIGWDYVLKVWAERRTGGMAVLDGVAAVVTAAQRLRGGPARVIARAEGEIPPA
jgi:uncharacterized protein YndB with AHSA1/START domain